MAVRSTMSKRVCVIGAGACGLTATKNCVEEGHQVVVYERTDNCGGLWRFRESDVDGQSSVMKSTIINTSKEMLAFSDFPPRKSFANFMHNRCMLQYLEDYAHHFGLLQHIRYKHEVLSISPKEDFDSTGRWVVKVRRTNNQGHEEETDEVFDGVMICTGHHTFPNIPQYPGQDSFEGKILHSHGLKNCDEMRDKDVMVVGTGNSGVDATVEASFFSRQVYLSSRQGFWLLYRVSENGRPYDSNLIRRVAFYLPVFVQKKILEIIAEKRINHGDYKLRPKHSIMAQHPTINDFLPNRILSGTVQVKGKIQKFTRNGVIFDGEHKETHLDYVIFATGYSLKFPFLDKSIAKVDNTCCELYQFVFPPQLKHPTLAFIGLVQPVGPIFPVFEIQSRWFARVLSGKCKLPSEAKMRKAIRARADHISKTYLTGIKYITEVEYIQYMENIAKQIGCKPNHLWMMLTDPKLFMAEIFGPFLPYTFRLRGPHAWPGARDAILNYQERVLYPLDTKKIGDDKKGGNKLKIFVSTVAIPVVFYWLYLLYPAILNYMKSPL